MASPAAIYAATFGGVDLQEHPLGLHLEVDINALYGSPEVRGADKTIPAMTGQTARSRELHGRVIRLEGPLLGIGDTNAEQMASFEAIAVGLRTIFDPLVIEELEVLMPSGDTWTINARPRNWLLDPAGRVPQKCRVNVELYSIDPDWVVTPAP